MKAAPFEYARASSVREAVALLRDAGGDARILAGGQNLVPMLNMRLVQPSVVVDVNGVDGLAGIRANGELRIGAMTRYSTVERSDQVARCAPLLVDAVRYVGDRLVRNRGTIGGSLAQADPSGEIPMAALALDAHVVVEGPAGTRTVAASDLFAGPYQTTLDPAELIVEVVVPSRPGSLHAVVEQARRHNDYAIVAVAAIGTPAPDGTWSSVRIALGAVAPTAVVATEAGELLAGRRLDDAAIRDAAAACIDLVDPSSDARASAEYRRHLVPVYVERALRAMVQRREGAS